MSISGILNITIKGKSSLAATSYGVDGSPRWLLEGGNSEETLSSTEVVLESKEGYGLGLGLGLGLEVVLDLNEGMAEDLTPLVLNLTLIEGRN